MRRLVFAAAIVFCLAGTTHAQTIPTFPFPGCDQVMQVSWANNELTLLDWLGYLDVNSPLGQAYAPYNNLFNYAVLIVPPALYTVENQQVISIFNDPGTITVAQGQCVLPFLLPINPYIGKVEEKVTRPLVNAKALFRKRFELS